MGKIFDYIVKLFIAISFLGTLILLYFSFSHKEIILNILDYFKQIVSNLGYWNYVIIFISSLLESFPLIGVSVPGQTVLIIVAGALGRPFMYFSMICASIGALLGNFLGYILGIRYGKKFFEKYGKWVGISPVDVKYIKRGIEKHGWLFVVFGKFHNMLRAFVPFVAGSLQMTTNNFTLFNIIGSILRGIIMVILGVFFIDNAEVILNNIGKILLILIIALIIYIYFFQQEKFKNYIKEKQKELE